MPKTIKKNLIRRDNTNNVTHIMKIYNDNTYEYTVLVLRSGCYIVRSRKTGICIE